MVVTVFNPVFLIILGEANGYICNQLVSHVNVSCNPESSADLNAPNSVIQRPMFRTTFVASFRKDFAALSTYLLHFVSCLGESLMNWSSCPNKRSLMSIASFNLKCDVTVRSPGIHCMKL